MAQKQEPFVVAAILPRRLVDQFTSRALLKAVSKPQIGQELFIALGIGIVTEIADDSNGNLVVSTTKRDGIILLMPPRARPVPGKKRRTVKRKEE